MIDLQKISKKELKDLAGIDPGENYSVIKAHPRDFLTSKRYIDILAKYLYAKARQEGKMTRWMINMYTHYIQAAKLESVSGRTREFHRILDSVRERGFVPEESIIPVNQNMDLWDGMHRIAAALLYDVPLVVLKMSRKVSVRPFQFYLDRGFPYEFLDQITLQYCRMNPSTKLAVVFPLVRERYPKVRAMLADHNICYEREIYLTRRGVGNLIAQMYKPKEWLNDLTREIHASRRFVSKEALRVLVLEPDHQEDLIKTKAEIRKMFHHEDLPVHTSDDHEETVRIAEQVFNKNSVHFFNYANPTKFQNFRELFERYKSWLQTNGYDKDELCVDGGAVLAAYGLRDCSDLDYVSFRNVPCGPAGIDSHDEFRFLYGEQLKELIFDPSNYFFYDGYKFLTLYRVMDMKKRRRDPKDKQDIGLIASVPQGSDIARKFRGIVSFKNLWNNIVIYGFQLFWEIYIHTPKRIKPILLKTYHIFKKMNHMIRRLLGHSIEYFYL